jgi:hypothetical protein
LNDIINFANNCTAYDIADGTIAAAAFSTSDNLWARWLPPIRRGSP